MLPAHNKEINKRKDDVQEKEIIEFSMFNDNNVKRKLPIIDLHINGKKCQVLLDSASTASIISRDILINHLNKSDIDITGPRGCIKGITGNIIKDLGRIDLDVQILSKTYKETFVIMEDTFFPAQVLFSIESMSRCGIKLDFSSRKLTLMEEDDKEGVAFHLADDRSYENRAHFLKPRTSREEHIRVSTTDKSSEPPLSSTTMCTNNELKPTLHLTEVATNLTPQGQNRSPNNEEEVSNVGRTKSPILQPKHNNLVFVQEEVSTEDSEYLNEALLLGQINRTEIIADSEETNGLDEQLCCFTEQSQERVNCVSTNDDNLVNFQTKREVILSPNVLTKVQLQAQTDELNLNKEIILLNEELPEYVKMDNALVNMRGKSCEAYVVNSTDKNIIIESGRNFCKGIVLDYKTLGVNGETFFSVTGNNVNIRDELNPTDFPERTDELIKILETYRDVVALKGEKLGRTQNIKHTIVLNSNAKPFFIPNYRLPISQRTIVDELITKMKEEGIVVPSKSPYNSPMLLVPKKDGSFRLVIDFRKLNTLTVPDRMPMPVINDVLSQLGGAKVFSSLDMLSGYWQVPMDEESKHLTAFSTHNEHLQFQVMPFGLTSAPLTFVRLMFEILGNLKNVSVYLDDVIIFSKDIKSHFETLEIVLQRLRNAGLKINLAKCKLLVNELEFLGHKLTQDGIKMQEGKIKAIIDYPQPKSLKALRHFLGMIGYYRPFIKHFATIAKPLTELTKKDVPYVWEEAQNNAFNILKDCMVTDPILTYPDFTKEFFLACDASSTGLGAVLLQKGSCRMKAISYASRVLNDTERRYSTTERECLALFWGLRKFRHLILGYRVNVLTDHKPLLDLFKRRNFTDNMKFNRWFIAVLEFMPQFQYIPGRFNTLADGLSRTFEESEKVVSTNSFCFSCQIVDLDLERMKVEQDRDPVIRNIVGEILLGEQEITGFNIINNLLYKTSEKCNRLYIPNSLRKEVLTLVHSHKLAGHPGIKKTCRTISRNYYWPKCTKEAINFVKACVICNQHKGVVSRPAPLEKYDYELLPFEKVTMDFMGPFSTANSGMKYCLVFIDYLTRYVEIVPTRDRTAASVAEALRKCIITRHSCPRVLMSDNAAEFTSDILIRLCQFYNVKKVEITAYKPSSNGAVERQNKKIKEVLRTIVTPDNMDWDKVLEDVQFTLNNTVNETVGETPHYLLYGYDKRIPVNLLDDAPPPRKTYNYDDYIAFRNKLAYDTIRKTRNMLQKGHETAKKYYDQKSINSKLEIGSQVYIKKNVPDGPNHKLSPKFEGPFRVLEKLKFNKYKVVDEQFKTEKIVHNNHLKVVKTNDLWSFDEFVNSDENIHSLQDDENNSTNDGAGYNLRPRH